MDPIVLSEPFLSGATEKYPMNELVKAELDRISAALIYQRLTPDQYAQLYAAQQAIVWTVDQHSAKSPFETVMAGLVQPPCTERAIMNIPGD